MSTVADLLFDLEPAFLELYAACRTETLTSIERMYALHQATWYVHDRAIPGDLVECGVWRGGSVMLMARSLLARGCTDRRIWLYDTFGGMPAPGPEDVQAQSGRPASAILAERPRTTDDPYWGLAPRAVVEHNLRATGYPMHQFRLVEGDVLATLPEAAPERIAVLRLDTDWYRSTRHELEHLYPRLSPGGVLIVDDYGYWRGARQATDEYLRSLAAAPLLTRIDVTARLAVKPPEP